MTKILSKQICEKCGIPYEIQNRILVQNNPNYIGGTLKYVNCTLDFGQPENFVKLLNIIYTCGVNRNKYDYQLATLAFDEDDFCWYEEHKTFEERYLATLDVKLSKEYDTWDKNFIAKVTQSIREAEWKYE